jgi:hypothetical protein
MHREPVTLPPVITTRHNQPFASLSLFCGALTTTSGRLLGAGGSAGRREAPIGRECDTPGGKAELGQLAHFAGIGRIGIEEAGDLIEAPSIDRDQTILESAFEYNAILMTDNKNMKAAAQARKLFMLSPR